IRMIEIGGADRMRMQFDTAEIDHPRETRGIVNNDFFCSAAGGKRQSYRTKPVRRIGRRTLLIKRFALRPVYEAFQDERAVLNSAQRAGRDGKKIPNNIDLRKLRLFCEIRLVGMRDADFAAF